MKKFKLTEEIDQSLKDKLLSHKELMLIFNSKKTKTREYFVDCIVEKDYEKWEKYLYDGNMIINKIR